MRHRWNATRRWLHTQRLQDARHVVRRWHQQLAQTLRTARRRVPRRSAPPVATLIGDVLQVDPIQAVQWHRAWLTYLDAKARAVAFRQATHRALLNEEDAA